MNGIQLGFVSCETWHQVPLKVMATGMVLCSVYRRSK